MIQFVLAILLGVSGPPTHEPCEAAKLTGVRVDVDDHFGPAIAVYGNTLVVGDPCAFDGLGAAYVFRRRVGEWQLSTILTPSVADLDTQFGASVAIQGEWIGVGAEDASAPLLGSGAVEMFHEVGGAWVFGARLSAPDPAPEARFGRSVEIDGSRMIVGAPLHTVDGVFQVGTAYVFRQEGDRWINEAALADPNGEMGDALGWSVSLHGSVALVGAHGNDDPAGGAGAVFAFRSENSQWHLEAEIVRSDAGPSDAFGWDVVTNGVVAAISSVFDGGNEGAVHVFRFDGIDWLEEIRLVPADLSGTATLFGIDLAISADGNLVVAGAPGDGPLGPRSGSVFVFQNLNEGWSEISKITPSDGVPDQRFGIGVALHGDTAAFGAIGPGSSSPGMAYAFVGMRPVDCNRNDAPDGCDVWLGESQDVNSNGVPDECETLADLDGDGVVGPLDLGLLLDQWGTCVEPCPPACVGDVDLDCRVGFEDLLLLLSWWG